MFGFACVCLDRQGSPCSTRTKPLPLQRYAKRSIACLILVIGELRRCRDQTAFEGSLERGARSAVHLSIMTRSF